VTEKNKDLSDKLKANVVKGTIDPPMKKHGIHIEEHDTLWDRRRDDEAPEGEKRALDGNR
jgi:hypothetical protein